jgi:hypothetical protein
MFQGIVSERLAKSQISARHPVRRQVPDERFSQGPIHPFPWGIRTNAAGYSVIADASGTEVLLAFGEDPQTSRAVPEFVVRSLLSYSRP